MYESVISARKTRARTNWIVHTIVAALMAFPAAGASAQERTPTFAPPSAQLGPQVQLHAADSDAVRDALDLIASDLVGGSISFGSSDHLGFDVFSTPLTLFPTLGQDYFVMSTGEAASAFLLNDSGGLSTPFDPQFPNAGLAGLSTIKGQDLVQTTLVLQPPVAASCLAFDFAFYSEEFPEFVISPYNDAFLAELGTSTFQFVPNDPENLFLGDHIIAPNNFAFDTAGNVVAVNTVFAVTAGEAAGTTYDGGTPLLTAKTPLENIGEVARPPITVILSIMDLGDSIYDSTVFIDHFRWLFGVACESGADVDTDRDALLDRWETEGIDFNNDDEIDLDLPAMGADPLHKDIFVEIDYMDETGTSHNDKPLPAALQIVIDTFNNAPVTNPDGMPGIHIHIDAGPGTIMDPVTLATWGVLSQSDALPHPPNFGTQSPACLYEWAAFDTIKGVGTPGAFSIERGDVFHYAISAHNLAAADGNCGTMKGVSGIARGAPGSDFIVSLGAYSDANPSQLTVGVWAGTLLHELGHGLSFTHGGDDEAGNYEPNYLSVMNYMFQSRGLRVDGFDGTYDYSRFVLDPLDEANLNEIAGISGLPPGSLAYGTHFWDSSDTEVDIDDINAAIDWNRDTGAPPEPDVSEMVDINGTTHMEGFTPFPLGTGYCNSTPEACVVNGDCSEGVCNTLTVLEGSNNWAEIVYNGGAVGALGEVVVQPSESEVIDITLEEDLLMTTEFAVSVEGPGQVFRAPGSMVTYSLVITNIGDAPETFDVTATDLPLPGWADFTPFPFSTPFLDPGEALSFDVTVTVPLGELPGTEDVLTVTAASVMNPSIFDAVEITTVVSIVTIDIRPDDDPNPVLPESRSRLPVAILGTVAFDVEDVDVTTLSFGVGGAAPLHTIGVNHFRDVNGDGFVDLVSHYQTDEAGISMGDPAACLMGALLDATAFESCDTIHTLRKGKK